MRHLAITGIVTASMIFMIKLGVGHARYAALCADIGGDPLERHDGARACFLGDLGMLRRDDVHDDAALEHLCQAFLDSESTGLLFHIILLKVGVWLFYHVGFCSPNSWSGPPELSF